MLYRKIVTALIAVAGVVILVSLFVFRPSAGGPSGDEIVANAAVSGAVTENPSEEPTPTDGTPASRSAVDVNPKINPYVWWSHGKQKVSPKNGAPYADRSKDFPHKITHSDLCYKLFHKRGYFWGGDWIYTKDYQHFQKR